MLKVICWLHFDIFSPLPEQAIFSSKHLFLSTAFLIILLDFISDSSAFYNFRILIKLFFFQLSLVCFLLFYNFHSIIFQLLFFSFFYIFLLFSFSVYLVKLFTGSRRDNSGEFYLSSIASFGHLIGRSLETVQFVDEEKKRFALRHFIVLCLFTLSVNQRLIVRNSGLEKNTVKILRCCIYLKYPCLLLEGKNFFAKFYVVIRSLKRKVLFSTVAQTDQKKGLKTASVTL